MSQAERPHALVTKKIKEQTFQPTPTGGGRVGAEAELPTSVQRNHTSPYNTNNI